MAAVWQAMLGDDGGAALAAHIAAFSLTQTSVRQALSSEENTTLARAFRTIIKNRVSHGGILAAGSGLLKQGENGRGIASRWYPETLCKRILEIGVRRERILFVHGNGL